MRDDNQPATLGSVEDFIVRSATFQSHVAVISTNQAYGAGTMIADWPTQILAHCPEKKEDYVTATINLRRLRKVRAHSRNFQQRRPELYGEIVRPRLASEEIQGDGADSQPLP